MSDFVGDLLFEDSADGGQPVIENGLFECDKGFSTSVYLSLFGGNEDDDGITQNNKDWWGNVLGEKKSAMVSRFQNVIKACPLNSANLKKAVDAAKSDLAWLIDEKIADEVFVTGRILSVHEAIFNVVINNGGLNLLESEYKVNWEAMNGTKK